MTQPEPSRELRREQTIDRLESDEDEQDAASSSISKQTRGPLGKLANAYDRFSAWFAVHANFYRIHLTLFTLIPLVASAIIWGADDGTHEYVSILTVSTSAMTVTGLNPILMETLSHFQQAVLFFLCCIGSTTSVSLITIIIRRYYFGKRFAQMVKDDPRIRKRVRDIEEEEARRHRYHNVLHPFAYKGQPVPEDRKHSPNGHASRSPAYSAHTTPDASRSGTPQPVKQKKRKRDRLRVDMIRRIDAPVRVNQMNVGGFLTDNHSSPKHRQSLELQPMARPQEENVLGRAVTRSDSPGQMSYEGTAPAPTDAQPASPRQRKVSIDPTLQPPNRAAILLTEATPGTSIAAASAIADSSSGDSTSSDEEESTDSDTRQAAVRQHARRTSDPVLPSARPAKTAERDLKRIRTMDPPISVNSPVTNNFPRTQTIGIREPTVPEREIRRIPTVALPHVGTNQPEGLRRRAPTGASQFGGSVERTSSRRASVYAGNTLQRTVTRTGGAMGSGFGGFPNPVKVAASAVSNRLLSSGTTGPNELGRTTTLQSVHSESGTGLSDFAAGPTRAVSYISFDAVVGRNSRFYSLTSAQRDELGGVEYRALSMLLKIVAAYYVLVQLIPMIILIPIFQGGHYNWLFRDQDQGSITGAGGWYVTFNVVSAYSNAGLSLLDESMTPFQQSYGYILTLCFLILAGNTAFPIFLRLIIWTFSKMVPDRSRSKETLQFLLDHPRRCFIYLFPSHNTWLLVILLVMFNSIDWICFLVLDIGNAVVYSLPPAARAIDGLLQSFAVRAAGFSIVALGDTAPALQVLYVVMMYLSVYPLAISVRSTNVYEEKAMGVYTEDDDSIVEAELEKNKKTGGYFAHHLRKQLAFDIWWIGLALWGICIVERANIDDPATDSYFNVFTILFELISAYGTVGLSLGSPNANYSLCGDFRIVSKLILCAVMIRGRHRGLPLAIDRSILLPSDLENMHSRTTDSAANGFSRMTTGTEKKGDNNVAAYYEADGNGTMQRAPTISKKASRRSSSGGGGSQPKRQASGQLQQRSGHSRHGSRDSRHNGFAADGLAAQPEKSGKGGLNGYLSTIYSEGTMPMPSPSPGDSDSLGLQLRGSPQDPNKEH